MKRNLYIGTAGWSNPPTARRARPAAESHLQHYAARFNAVEINSSFYRPHQRETYERWRDSTPAGFRFAVKAPQTVTHECGLRHYRTPLRQFLEEIAGLGRKLRVILVQTPASLPFESRVATRFFATLTAATPCRIACEPRHPSWFSARAEDTLRRYDVSRVAADPAKIPGAGEPSGAAQWVYYRLHGSPRMYYSSYSADYLRELSEKLKTLRGPVKETWCVFDNTARHAAWDNALDLHKLLRG